MAPPNSQKRVKGVSVRRPFMFGTTARPFDLVTNPKPSGVPEDHTHSWTIFVRGIDDTDITYWLKKVQFKLHDSIPNPLRTVEGVPGQDFHIDETGWGEFEIVLKIYYVPESNEKPQTLYHNLKLHPYGTEEEKAASRANGSEVLSWAYEEQVFNEPYEQFYDILTTGPPKGKGGHGKRKSLGQGVVMERTAMVPQRASPGQPFSSETEMLEVKKLKDAQLKVDEMTRKLQNDLKVKETLIASLRAGGKIVS